MSRVFIIPSICLLLIALLSFFGRDLLHTSAAVRPDDIVFANGSEIISRDTTQMTWSQDIRLAMGLFEGLVAYDPVTLEPVPGVAESWEHSADGLTWTFHLRHDAKWSNGDRVVAGDFAFAWKRALTAASGCQYESLFNVIQNATAYFDAQDKTKNLPAVSWEQVGIKVRDEFTLEVKLASPCTYMLDLMAFPTFFPQNQRAMQPFKTGGDYSADFTNPPNLVSNGAFMLKEAREREYHLLEPNEYYWDRKNVKATGIRMVARTDEAAALIEFENGGLDVLSFVPNKFAADLLKDQNAGLRQDVHMQSVFGTYYYLFNCTRKPYSDARVRMALSLVVDKKRIVEKVTRLYQTPITTIVPVNSIPGYTSPPGLVMDVERARKLLAEAGFPEGKGFPEVELLYNSDAEIHQMIAQTVGQMWQQELKIPVKYKAVDGKTFHGLRQLDHDFDVARAGWYGDYMDPVTWLDLFKSGDGNNDGLYSNKEYDALLAEAAKEPDPAKRFGILKQAETILTDHDLPFLPLYQTKDGYMFDPKKIGGLELNVRLLTQLKTLYRVKPAAGGAK